MQKSAPKDPAGFALEGDIQRQQKNWPAAITAHRSALDLARGTEGAIRLHQTYVAADRAADADRFATDWRRDHPSDMVFRFYLGDQAVARQDWPAAEGHYKAVAQAQPRNALAMNNAAWAMVQQGKPGAVALAEQATQILPGRPQLMDTLAAALAAENQLPKAIETQKQALARSPQDPSLRLHLARLYLKAGQKPQARAELEDLARLGDRFAAQGEVSKLLEGVR
jgi:predicted Zn-dependent protease